MLLFMLVVLGLLLLLLRTLKEQFMLFVLLVILVFMFMLAELLVKPTVVVDFAIFWVVDLDKCGFCSDDEEDIAYLGLLLLGLLLIYLGLDVYFTLLLLLPLQLLCLFFLIVL